MPTGTGARCAGDGGGVTRAVYTEPRLGGVSGKESVASRDSSVASTSCSAFS
jgi:hypothetical protein